MTAEEFGKIKWKFKTSLDCNGYGAVTYQTVNHVPVMYMCRTSPNPYMYNGDPEDMPVKRSTTHFMVNGIVYKTKKALFNALNITE